MNALAESIVEFWFAAPEASGTNSRWFQSDEEFDTRIRDSFQSLLPRASQGEFESWGQNPDSWLAYILLTDQFPRNIFRGSEKAFAFDHLALHMARRGLAQGLDRRLTILERVFAYLPFEHSESMEDQNLACALMRQLNEEAPEDQAQWIQSSLEFAELHRDIIARFGRFVHRNATLRRASSEAELDYLKEGKRFGQ